MKNITMGEFEDICRNFAPSHYYLDSGDQQIRTGETLSFVLSFDSVETICLPRSVILRGGCGMLELRRVKSIHICDESCAIRLLFKIVCKGLPDNEEDVSYMILAE